MKKFICIFLSILMILGTVALVSCNKNDDNNDAGKETDKNPATEAALKFGMGVYTGAPETAAATNDTNGMGTISVTVAVLTVDANGRVAAVEIDTAESTVEWTKDGKAIANAEFKTKYELGFDYNMVNYHVSEKEWFEQVDAFETAIVGKTLDEIKALVVEGYKPNQEVQTAGCTIAISDFVGAVEKAFANLKDSTATASSTVKLGMATTQDTEDATADVDGVSSIETTIFGAVVDAQGKVLASEIDSVAVDFTFNTSGASTLKASAVSSKRELGFGYNMVNYHASEKEWFEQADIFKTFCTGKTAAEIVALCAEGSAYGTDAVKTAGCTIKVDGFTKAAAKIG